MKQLILALLFLLLVQYLFSQDGRLALVIGNGIYDNAPPLANPENDAKAISKKLKSLNFDVMEYTNLDQKSMKMAIDKFGIKLKSYDVGLFFYAGHGLQVNGINFLIPSDANLIDETDVEYNCVRADRILGKMESSNTSTNIVILDACRDNPFERSWNRGMKGKGLAFMNAPAGSIIAYATNPGNTASDGTNKNGLYTEALLKYIGISNLSIVNTFMKVRIDVEKKSNGRQIPWESTSLKGNFYFKFDENLPLYNEEEIPSQWVIITSEPEEADLYINDQHVGQTPFQQEMKEGTYEYNLKKDLHYSQAGKFDLIASEGRKKIEVKLNPNYGFAKIKTLPENGANVSIDGKLQNNTSNMVTGMLKSGTHTVTVSKNLYKTKTQSFDINDGQTTEVVIDMIPNFGTIIINSLPENGAKVTIDGIPTGKTTPYIDNKFKSGEYTITLRKDMYETQTKRIKIGDGENKEISFNMKPIFGEVKITSNPSADIFIDGELKGTGTYIDRLSTGLHTIEAKKEKHHTDQKKVDIVIGINKEIVLSPKPMIGSLKVIVMPIETSIKLNGKDYGTTPLTIEKLPIGTYTVELIKDGYSKITKKVEIKDNAVTELNERLSSISPATTESTKKKSEIPLKSDKKEGTISKPEKKSLEISESTEKASKTSSVKAGKMIIMSSVVPGLGLSKLSNGKPYWLLAVAEGICITTSVIYNQKALSGFSDYKNPTDINQVKKTYDNAKKQQTLSRILGATAATIWVADIAVTGIKAAKMKNSMSNRGKTKLSVGFQYNTINDSPMISLNYKF